MGRLGCDALTVNAFTDEHRPVLVEEDVNELVEELAEHVKKSGSDLGVLLEPGGEIAHLVDDKGRRIGHATALLAFIRHEARSGAGLVAVPVSASRHCEAVATANGAEVQRTPTAMPALMARAGQPGVGFAGNPDGALLFPAFMPAPDGLMTFAKSLEVIAVEQRPWSETVDDLPAVHIARRDVSTPWHQKGAVMRNVALSAPSESLTLIDGVKVTDEDGWALVIPLPDQPLCRIWAEGATAADAERIADRYAAMVYEVTQSEAT